VIENPVVVMETVTSKGCTMKLIAGFLEGEEGVMLTLDMKQPGDGRHAEAWLNADDALTVLQGLSDWGYRG
jgi:hypothetical protein